jgi:hypothetical protein
VLPDFFIFVMAAGSLWITSGINNFFLDVGVPQKVGCHIGNTCVIHHGLT